MIRLRIVFFGTPDFAVPTLDALLRSSHPVVGVVTQPDRPRGRGQRVTAGPVKQRALDAGIAVLQPERLKDSSFIDALTALDADLGVVAAYGRILTDQVLTIPRRGMINVHASLLPRHRGAAPVHRAILAGETETGVTIMRVVKALDAGPMLAKVSHPIAPDATSDAIERALAMAGAALLVHTIDALAAGTVIDTPQDEALATYAPRLTKADGVIEWTRSAQEIHNQIRGLHPWPHAFSWLNGHRIIVHRSVLKKRPGPYDEPTRGGGTIIDASGRLLVATGTEPLELQILQLEGKRPMLVREFLAGHPITAGQRFVSAP
jgi:methionyl-tRNA formyltransferase